MTRIWWLAILMMGMAVMTIHAQKVKAFTLVHHTHSVQIVGRGIKVNIDYADNDPEAVDVFAKGIADYLNSLGDNPEFPEANKAKHQYGIYLPDKSQSVVNFKVIEPMDVPAIHKGANTCFDGTDHYAQCVVTCENGSGRILLIDIDGGAHCVKFPEAK